MILLPSFDLASPSILRLAILLPATTLAALSRVPPTQPPTRTERAKYASSGDFHTSELTRSVTIASYKVVYWGNLLCEAAFVLAPYLPSSITATIPALFGHASVDVSPNLPVTRWWLAGCALMAAGGAIRLLCFRTLGRFFTFELTIKKGHALVTSGPYAVVRHPSYTGSLLMGVGTLLCHFGPGSWYERCVGWNSFASKAFTVIWAGWSCVLPMLLVRRIATEDATLRKEFGGDWDAYAERTPYKLVPYIL